MPRAFIRLFVEQQQVSGKPFLRILSDGPPLGLAFETENDKNDVLELLKQRQYPQPESGPKSDERRDIFAANKDLEILYNQLVVAGILSENEFWSMHKSDLQLSHSKNVGKREGLSSVMHEVEKLHDGKTERVNIHLTPQDIERIFRDKPEVNKAFIAYVPHSLTEEEFWQKYFKLEYKQAARQKRVASGGILPSRSAPAIDDKDDIFAPFRQHITEQESLISLQKLNNVDPTLNLFAEYGDRWGGGSRILGADTLRSDEAIPEHMKDSADKCGDKYHRIKTLANELNRHSFYVLDGPIGETPNLGDSNMSSVSMAAALESARSKHLNKERSKVNPSVWKYRASSDLEDLRGHSENQTLPLSLKDKSAFGRVIHDATNLAQDVSTSNMETEDNHIISLCSLPLDSSNLLEVPYPSLSSLNSLEEFCMMDSEAFVKEFGSSGFSAAMMKPQDAMGSVMTEFFRIEALKTNELLRHYWLTRSNGNKEKMGHLSKHLSLQREALALHLQSQTGIAGQIQIYIMKIVSSLLEGINEALKA